MKWLDVVTVKSDDYEKQGIFRGDKGVIINAEIIFNTFSVMFEKKDGGFYCTDIAVEHLLLVADGGVTDEQLLSALPQKNPHRWCKLENGFILSLSGMRKNDYAYIYGY